MRAKLRSGLDCVWAVRGCRTFLLSFRHRQCSETFENEPDKGFCSNSQNQTVFPGYPQTLVTPLSVGLHVRSRLKFSAKIWQGKRSSLGFTAHQGQCAACPAHCAECSAEGCRRCQPRFMLRDGICEVLNERLYGPRLQFRANAIKDSQIIFKFYTKYITNTPSL